MSDRPSVETAKKSSGTASTNNKVVVNQTSAKNSSRVASMRANATIRNERNEASSKQVAASSVTVTKKSGSAGSRESSAAVVMKNNKTAAATVSKPIWQSVKQLGSRVSAKAKSAAAISGNNQQLHIKQSSSSKEDMVTSTETESSGVFSDSSAEGKTIITVSTTTRPTSRIIKSASSIRSTSNRITKQLPPAPSNSTASTNGE